MGQQCIVNLVTEIQIFKVIRITFNKTGALGGHIKIERKGKVVVDRELATKVDIANQVLGSDFLTGRQKLK